MKKLIGLLITVTALAAVLMGCVGKPAPDSSNERENGLVVIGFSQVGSESSWRVANSESMKAAFSEENGFELIFDDAKQKQENQYKAIRTFIQQDVDYIVLAPITENGWDDVLLEAKEAGIPVVIVDRQVNVKDDSLYVSWVGSNFLQEGQTAVNWLETEIAARIAEREAGITAGDAASAAGSDEGALSDANAGDAGSGSAAGDGEEDEEQAYSESRSDGQSGEDAEAGSEDGDTSEGAQAVTVPKRAKVHTYDTVGILHLKGTIGATSQIMRTKGLEDAVETHDNWKIIGTLEGEYTEAKSYELTTEFLKDEELADSIDVVYCENDNMAFGVMRAFNDAGIAYGGRDGVIIISFDAVRSALEQCLAGNINLAVECNPLHGPRAVSIIDLLEQGISPSKMLYVEETRFSYRDITREMIDERRY